MASPVDSATTGLGKEQLVGVVHEGRGDEVVELYVLCVVRPHTTWNNAAHARAHSIANFPMVGEKITLPGTRPVPASPYSWRVASVMSRVT